MTVTLTYADVTVTPSAGTIASDRGSIRLAEKLATVTALLMSRPGRILRNNELISAMYPHPDDEPEFPDVALRVQMTSLRYTLLVMSTKVRLINERGVGYAIVQRHQ